MRSTEKGLGATCLWWSTDTVSLMTIKLILKVMRVKTVFELNWNCSSTRSPKRLLTRVVPQMIVCYQKQNDCRLLPLSVFYFVFIFWVLPVFECCACCAMFCLFVPSGIARPPYAGCFAHQSDPGCQGLSAVVQPGCWVWPLRSTHWDLMNHCRLLSLKPDDGVCTGKPSYDQSLPLNSYLLSCRHYQSFT